MAVKNAILKAKIENEIVELMVKTGVENIVLMDDDVEKTLAEKLAEIVTALNGKAENTHTHAAATSETAGFLSAADKTKLDAAPTTESMNSAISAEISKLINGAPETYDTLKEIADYIAEHETVVETLNAAIGAKLGKSAFGEFKTTLGSLSTKSKVAESDLDDALAKKVNAASEGNHSHANKEVLDSISSGKVSNWDAAYTHAQTAHAPADAQANVIESLKVNGAAQEISGKEVNLDIPVIYTQTSQPPDLKAGDLFIQIIE